MPPPVPLEYVDGRLHSRVQVWGDGFGGEVIVPSRGSRAGWPLLWSAAAAVVLSLDLSLVAVLSGVAMLGVRLQ